MFAALSEEVLVLKRIRFATTTLTAFLFVCLPLAGFAQPSAKAAVQGSAAQGPCGINGAAADSSDVEHRAIRLHSHRNLRSLDSLPARGGVIRSGAVYRSARLTHMSPEDAEIIRALRLSTLIDVRVWLETVYEGGDSRAVTRVVPHRLALPMGASFLRSKTSRQILKGRISRVSVRRFFGILADAGAYPVLYHCALGKDRTGMLTALLLELLGTPRVVIMDDYIASGRDMRSSRLQTLFTEVDRQGGIEPFLRGYGVTDPELAAIRSNLIVPVSGRIRVGSYSP